MRVHVRRASLNRCSGGQPDQRQTRGLRPGHVVRFRDDAAFRGVDVRDVCQAAGAVGEERDAHDFVACRQPRARGGGEDGAAEVAGGDFGSVEGGEVVEGEVHQLDVDGVER